MPDETIEQLAAIEHERWADWMRYFLGKCEPYSDDSLHIPAGYVAALQRLIDTPYAELSEEQKENDRREVRRYLHLVGPKV